MYPELEDERDAAEKVKRETPILVILGNPPYNSFAGVSPIEEEGLVDAYKVGLSTDWGIKKFNLDDLYVRFFRLAERRIAETTGKGVVCFISNYSYLGDPSFVVMRQRLLVGFNSLWFDSMNGDSRETGKLTPDGRPDPSVFSTDQNREGIRVGTSIGLMVRGADSASQPKVRFRQFWGIDKRADLLNSLSIGDVNAGYKITDPRTDNRFSFRPNNVGEEYMTWPTIVEFCGEVPISGLQEMRKGSLMSIDKGTIENRMGLYYNPDVDWDSLKALQTGLTEDGGRFDAKESRTKVQSREKFDPENIKRYSLYPFDNRWCLHSNVRPLWNEPRPALAAQCWPGNSYIVTRMVSERPNEQHVMTCTTALPDYHLLRPNAVAIPVRLRSIPKEKGKSLQAELFDDPDEADGESKANLSTMARAYLASVGIDDPDRDAESAGLVWMHSLAIGYSPTYLINNGDGILKDWLRIPLPLTQNLLSHSVGLGRAVAALLETEVPVKGVTANPIRPELKTLAVVSHTGGLPLSPDDLGVTAGWSHPGKGGITMPGRGRVVIRDYTPDEVESIRAGSEALGLTPDDTLALLGPDTRDIYLNATAYWRNVPANVWAYTIGGYQVIKKWLSYREHVMLGRNLLPAEAREVSHMARRIAALILLQPELDANYAAVKANTYPWPVTP